MVYNEDDEDDDVETMDMDEIAASFDEGGKFPVDW